MLGGVYPRRALVFFFAASKAEKNFPFFETVKTLFEREVI